MEKGKIEGKSVSIVREARQGDSGYDESKNQVLVELEDGSLKCVSRNDIGDIKKNAPTTVPATDKNPGATITSTKQF